MCLFVGSEFSRSHRRLRTPSYTFTGFCWTHMYNQKYRGFHLRGYLSVLAIAQHIFSFSCIQPCDPVGRCPTVPSPPNQTPNTVLIITMHLHPCHAMFLCISAMQCAISCLYHVTYMMNAMWTILLMHITHASWTIISIGIKFPNDHTFHVNIFAHTYININKSLPIKQ